MLKPDSGTAAVNGFDVAPKPGRVRHFVQTAVGGWLREAGKKDRSQLIQFVDHYHTVMPSTMLRFAVEHLDKTQREQYVKGTKTSSKAASKRPKLERAKTQKS